MQGKFDLDDVVVSPLFVLSSAIATGLISFSLFGFDFASTAFQFASENYKTTISYASIISVLALLAAYASNRRDLSQMTNVERWITLATIGLVLFPPFMPLLEGMLSNQIAGLVAVIVQAGGFYSLSYAG
ncbi:hypothetical protein BV210_15035 [Halorientalis sp. IM1011]|uniref:hypothetical protein n=1 Tax=Halorientalis sp. IM1011 TaxID=1932360 RepID=UPI00097CCB26|nr:hypothetical protein [Halorientalis sp. IM1011]AQL43935.1 hypothetical protein BV210_15035 [Halorientalis sp. IM1011]